MGMNECSEWGRRRLMGKDDFKPNKTAEERQRDVKAVSKESLDRFLGGDDKPELAAYMARALPGYSTVDLFLLAH